MTVGLDQSLVTSRVCLVAGVEARTAATTAGRALALLYFS